MRRAFGRIAVLACGALAVSACSPALDWRRVALDDSGVAATLPCRPSVYQRSVRLQQGSLALMLRACSTEGVTWAVAHATVAEPALVAPTLRALSLAAATNVGLSAIPTDARRWSPRGATPSEAALRWRGAGRLPDGRGVHAETAVFARGMRVFQATMIGSGAIEGAADMFFDGLQVLE